MNETDLNNVDDDNELDKLMWDQLMIEEKIVMKAYVNNLSNNKTIHTRLHQAVQIIMDRYPDFDVSFVP